VRLDEFLLLLSVIVFAAVAVFLALKSKTNPHRTLTRLIAANIVLDIIAIVIWAFPATQWSIYRLGFPVAGAEAALAAVLFALTLFGLNKRRMWAPILAIAMTLTQRVFATYIFFPSPALALTLIWSLIIITFAYKDIKTKSTSQRPK
jgi:hypothetical protein